MKRATLNMQHIDNSEIIFIINPNSGKRKVSRIVDQIKKMDDALLYVITKNVEEVKEVFHRYLETYKVFVIVGGDGSVNEALKYLQNRPEKYLSVYPNGSGNGFARELGFKRDIRSLLRDINKGDSMDLDLLRVNGSLSINMSGVGIDSYVAHAFGNAKSRGLINYILLTIKSLISFKPFKATISSEDFRIEGIYQMITIANTRQFGNNALIAPGAIPNDGTMEVVLVKPLPIFLLPYFAIQLFLGLLKKNRYIDFIRTGDPVTIDSQYHEFHVDGEPVTFHKSVYVSIDRNKMKVIRTAHNTL